jgi:NAD(P)H-hydrate epimerase
MQTVVSAEEMRWCDATAINTYGVPGLVLMENAGSAVAWFVEENFGPVEGKQILIACGKGNNGGDGYVAARHLLNQGASVQVVLMASPRELRGDAKTNFQILAKLQKAESSRLSIIQYSQRLPKSLRPPDIIIDALLGTGFSGSVRPPMSNLIAWINAQHVPVIAVDVPSGVDASTGVVENVAVEASATVTFGALKVGLLCHQGQDCAGDVLVADIGIPRHVLHASRLKTFLVETQDVHARLPGRASTAHKYSVGKVFVLAGSKGYTGAAALTATAALRAGAGAVMLGIPESVYPILAKKLTGEIVVPLHSTEAGTLSADALSSIREKIQWADVVVIGPGLSQHPETQAVIQHLLLDNRSKMLVDADGLNALARTGITKLKKTVGEFILTPHTGEFSRLSGLSSETIERDRVKAARDFAVKADSTVVLKGGPTVTATPEGFAFINSTGNPGMATVGSGDVLSGLIAGLWAQGMQAEDAALAGVFLHGLSGNIARSKLGQRSLVAQDLIDFLPQAFSEVERT